MPSDPAGDIVLDSAGGEVEDFTWHDAERLIRFGSGAVGDIPALLAERGFDGYALLTTERASGQAPALAERASVVLHVPGGLVPNAAAAVRGRVEGRPLVALGGGRVVDAAKAISAADGPPCAAVPTTLAGSPITRVHRLPDGVSGVELVRPSLVVADPDLSASQPMPDLAASAMNALAHAVESLYAPRRSPVTEMAAMRAVAAIAAGLANEEPVRRKLALGAVLGAWAVGATGYSVHHPVCQTLVAGVGTPHAATNAVLLPHSVRFAAPRARRPAGRRARRGASRPGARGRPRGHARRARRADTPVGAGRGVRAPRRRGRGRVRARGARRDAGRTPERARAAGAPRGGAVIAAPGCPPARRRA